jgi:DNA-binding ferritin-like protein (Dps family)
MSDILSKIIGELEAKKEWKATEARAKALPEEYRTVYDEIKKYVWHGGAGITDPTNLFQRLVDLFEAGVKDGKHVLEITGDDVAAFVKEQLRGEKTVIEDIHEKLNSTIAKKLGK